MGEGIPVFPSSLLYETLLCIMYMYVYVHVCVHIHAGAPPKDATDIWCCWWWCRVKTSNNESTDYGKFTQKTTRQGNHYNLMYNVCMYITYYCSWIQLWSEPMFFLNCVIHDIHGKNAQSTVARKPPMHTRHMYTKYQDTRCPACRTEYNGLHVQIHDVHVRATCVCRFLLC